MYIVFLNSFLFNWSLSIPHAINNCNYASIINKFKYLIKKWTSFYDKKYPTTKLYNLITSKNLVDV